MREAALEAGYTVPLPLPLVVIRCADRVPAVRARARRLLVGYVAAHASHILPAAVPLVLRLGGREHGGWAVELVEAALHDRAPRLAQWWRVGLLTGPPSRKKADAILAGLRRNADLPTRRFAARITLYRGRTTLRDLTWGRTTVRDLAREAAAELDPATARMWTDATMRALALLGARQPLVRAAGVTALRRAGRAAEGVRHLADPSGRVRACARWLVGQDGGDAHQHYRRLVADPAGPSPYAVTGLAECGDEEDVPLLRELLAHPVGRVRSAAVAGLRVLGAPVKVRVLLALVDDPAPSVAREAARSLLPKAALLPLAGLLARLTPMRPLHTRRAAFRLLRARGGVAELRACVELLTVWDLQLRTTAQAVVRGWDWRFTREADRAELTVLLRRSAHLFDEGELRRRRRDLALNG